MIYVTLEAGLGTLFDKAVIMTEFSQKNNKKNLNKCLICENDVVDNLNGTSLY